MQSQTESVGTASLSSPVSASAQAHTAAAAVVGELSAECALINRTLHLLEDWLDDAKHDPVQLRQILRLLREFAVDVHQLKESSMLFPFIQRFGVGRQSMIPGPLESEQLEAIGLLTDLEERARQSSYDADTEITIKKSARRYLALMRNHLRKKQDIFYPLLVQRLPANSWIELQGRFADFRDERDCAGFNEEIDDLVRALFGDN